MLWLEWILLLAVLWAEQSEAVAVVVVAVARVEAVRVTMGIITLSGSLSAKRHPRISQQRQVLHRKKKYR